MLNTAGGVRGFAQLLEEDLPPGTRERDEARQLGSLAERVIEEIECQRDLTGAENGELVVTPKPFRAVEMLNELRTLYAAHELAAGREIVLAASVGKCPAIVGGRLAKPNACPHYTRQVI